MSATTYIYESMARACVLSIAVIAWFWSDWELGAAWAEETGKKTNKRKHKGGLAVAGPALWNKWKYLI